jgi:hypothetical protein
VFLGKFKSVTQPDVPDGFPQAFYVQHVDESLANLQLMLDIAVSGGFHRPHNPVIHRQRFICEDLKNFQQQQLTRLLPREKPVLLKPVIIVQETLCCDLQTSKSLFHL